MPKSKRIKLGDREGMVIYLDGDFNPVELEQATIMKILFDNGDTMWAKPQLLPAAEVKQ